MGIYTQRKWFEDFGLAVLQAEGLLDLRHSVPTLKVGTKVDKEGDGAWLYLTQEGDLVTDEAIILPGYEKVG